MITTSWGKFVLMKRPSPVDSTRLDSTQSVFFFLLPFSIGKDYRRRPSVHPHLSLLLFDLCVCVCASLHIGDIMDLWPSFSPLSQSLPRPCVLATTTTTTTNYYVFCGLFSRSRSPNKHQTSRDVLLSLSYQFLNSVSKHYSRSRPLSALSFCTYVCMQPSSLLLSQFSFFFSKERRETERRKEINYYYASCRALFFLRRRRREKKGNDGPLQEDVSQWNVLKTPHPV